MAKKTKAATRQFMATSRSWSIDGWPAGVYPKPADAATTDDEKAAIAHRIRWMIRAHRDELAKVGALVRVGRQLVILEVPFLSWLQSRSACVDDFGIAPNRSRKTTGESIAA